MNERTPYISHQTKPVQERPEPAVTIEGINTVTAEASGVFRVTLDAQWRERPTFDGLATEIEQAIRCVLERHASK